MQPHIDVAVGYVVRDAKGKMEEDEKKPDFRFRAVVGQPSQNQTNASG